MICTCAVHCSNTCEAAHCPPGTPRCKCWCHEKNHMSEVTTKALAYHWIKFDETKHWDKKFLSSIGPDAKIITTYVFDHNRQVNCSELTPSYELHYAGIEFCTSRELTDAERETIEEQLRESQNADDGVKYIHCSSIDSRNSSKPIRQFEGCECDVKIDDVIEYFQGNPW